MYDLDFTCADSLQASFTATALRTKVLQDPVVPGDILSIETQPSRGRATLRGDGHITLDLTEETAATPLTFQYTRDNGGNVETVTATVTVSLGRKGGGWGTATNYMLATDSNDAVIVTPGENTRQLFISTSGLDAAAIVALEPSLTDVSQVTGTWLRDNTANGEGGLYYGESEALALDQTLGNALLTRLDKDFLWTSHHTRFKRGDTFGPYGVTFTGIGESRLHPSLSGAYGTGDLPRFNGIGPTIQSYCSYIVAQDLSYGIGLSVKESSGVIIDNAYADYAQQVGGTGTSTYTYAISASVTIIEGLTLRRFVSLDSFPKAPNQATWQTNGDRCSGAYCSGTRGTLIEKGFIDHAGWGDGYNLGADPAYPKPAEDRSHGAYLQTVNQDVTVRDCIITRNGHSAIQNRPSALLHNIFSAGNDDGTNPANGPYDVPGAVDKGNWSFTNRFVHTVAGFKESSLGTTNISAGCFHVNTLSAAVADSVWLNAGAPVIDSDLSHFGPAMLSAPTGTEYRHPTFADYPPTGEQVSSVRSDYAVSNWNRDLYPDVIYIGSTTQEERDALTMGACADDLLSTTGSDLDSFCAYLRTLDSPWELVTDLTDWFLTHFGKASSTRSVATTVYFRPEVDGETPGMRADFPRDWSTGDLPGFVDGDSIHLDGHRVYWNMNPENTIANFSFGPNGKIVVHGGLLDITGTLNVDAGGNTIKLGSHTVGGGECYINEYSGAGLLSVEAIDSRFMMKGTVTGPVNVAARYGSEVIVWEGGAWTLQSGCSLDVYGYAKVGFDGTGGGAASISFAAGSTVRFLPTTRMEIDGQTLIETDMDLVPGGSDPVVVSTYQPYANGIVTGSGGAAGVCACLIRRKNVGGFLMLDGLTGVFADNDTLDADCELAFFDRGPQTAFATVAGTPAYVLGQIREVRTGINGFTAPNVAGTINLNGNHLVVDIVGHGNVTNQVLMSADAIAHNANFASVTIENGSAKDVTIDVTATQILLTIANGSGGVTVNYPV